MQLNLLSSRPRLSFLTETEGCHDVMIVTSDKKVVKCHSVVLAAASPVFADVMRTASGEDENIVIIAENMNEHDVDLFLEFLYNGTIQEKMQGEKS